MTLRTLLTLVTSLAVVGALVSGCGDDGPPSITYVVDARIDTYNANTVDGNAGGALMATTRLLPGFSYLGAQGQVTPDRDIGTVTPVAGPALTLRYDFAPEATFSDGHAMACDDLLLAWAAMSGRMPGGFAPATTAGYRDIERVDCTPGTRTATVTFARGRAYSDWLALFRAGTMLPAHIVAQQAGVPNVVDPIRTGDRAALTKIARAWNAGFALAPGSIDTARFPSSGPYRIDSYSATDGLVLVANDKWWGDAPPVGRIVIRPTSAQQRVPDGAYDIADVTAGISTTEIAPAEGPKQPFPQPNRALAVESIVLSQRGALGDVRARQALASCVPRDQLARQFGRGAQTWNLRVLAPADNLAGQLNASFGREYLRADVPRAKAQVAELRAGGAGPLRVRIGYLAPTPRWQQMVGAITESCRAAGIEVVDAGSSDITPGALGRDVDALIVADGASFAAAGAANPSRDAYQLYGGDPLNLGGYRNPEVSAAIDELVVSDLASDRLRLVRTIENAAWAGLPSIPLFAAPRDRQWGSRVANVMPGLGRNGTGWNMDRWVAHEQ
ncbi:ABC transporter substrate-binding protein [Gordonia sp. CPCC 205515]|uniref:ABC transporter substrate-binding protein n=1 Tax=Gordonia sp. CPCC 205515 TaxID=3140791 RepID=UPI003AF3A4A9